MKLELKREYKVGEELWYSLFVDDKYVTGSYSINKALELYDEIKSGKFKDTIILKSEEIDLSLGEIKPNII